MKSDLSSVDVRVLSRELDSLLKSARIDKIYQTGPRELKIGVHTKDSGSKDLVVAPNFLCLSSYKRPSPEKPSSFAMKLRKHLKGGFIREVRQHEFDRIVEVKIEHSNETYTLVIELFSKGNVILCSTDKTILDLMEWQKWRDRLLGVRQKYEYPPNKGNPLKLSHEAFDTLVSDASQREVVKVLASDLGLGGFYAEELCLKTGLDKNTPCSELGEIDRGNVYESVTGLLNRINSGELNPRVVYGKEGEPVDVIPLDSLQYRDYGTKEFSSFNDAVDEYFSRLESESIADDAGDRIKKKLEKLEHMREKQSEALEKLEKRSVEYKRVGDFLYQNMQSMEELTNFIKSARAKGLSDDQILNEIKSDTRVKKIEGYKLVLDI